MKSVSILISNRNSLEMIQLCILSIRHYTRYPNYKIIVYDDYSSYFVGKERKPNMVDINFLRTARDKGWIELHENPGPTKLKHGGVLRKLLNEICETDYAVIMDADVQIRGYDWLWDLINTAEVNSKIIAVVNKTSVNFSQTCYRMPVYLFQLGLMNMKAYRDGMQVDWGLETRDRKEWPYSEETKDYYPPENCKYSAMFFNVKRDTFDPSLVILDPGAKLYIKVRHYNPKGYKVAPMPPQVKGKYYHYGHISMISDPNDKQHEEEREGKFSIIRGEIKRMEEL